MKRLALVLLFSLSVPPISYGESGTWVGTVSDSKCGPSHKNGPSTGGQMLNDAECVELCVESGGKFALVTDSGVYSIANPEFKGIRSNIGKVIQVDGDVKGTAITVTKISSVRKKAQ